MITQGTPAPDFQLHDDSGNTVKLSDLRGKNVVLYFYPKDDTPGCTTEACEFRDEYAALSAKNTVVLGVSPDDTTSHGNFKSKFNLPFPLLADTDHHVAEQYGAWGERNIYGKTHIGILRTTYVIGPEGHVKKVFEKVKPVGHGKEVLAAIIA